ncbi:MAG: NAD(P)-binding domain-containing protein [Gemmatimonadota bacterium]|nr:NAD(P)-binding domain-containing protein [Gemmatimonadota bacterium]MDH4351974.1 NAD(P)-binding domain-containing protein [Gemmatimonadota bacterium]
MGGTRRVIVVGAGPIGLEAAAAAVAAGHAVTVLERGDVADHVRQWGHVQLFTAFGMNSGPAGRALLEAAGVLLPADGEHLSGATWRERYLLPLAAALRDQVRLETGATVRHVSRPHLLKSDAVGETSRRAADGFRVFFDQHHGEHVLDADAVLDCSGTWGTPNWLGPGGAPALGERALRSAICYHPPDVLFAEFDRYGGRHVCLVGNGDSAATTVLALAQLAETVAGTRVTWVTRTGGGRPVAARPDDPLPGRRSVVALANAVATAGGDVVRWIRDAQIVEITKDAKGFALRLETRDGEWVEQADEVIANIGYEPDDSLYRALQVHECYASRAPMKLSAALSAASGKGGADCLDLGGFGPDVLKNPEPDFFILGAKSYGKTSAFLLRTGYEQVRDVMGLIGG